MPAEVKEQVRLEVAHVLFIDTVGYSKLSINEQRMVVDELTTIVRASDQYRKAEATGRLIKIPTGDGMALVFYTNQEAPAQCAIEISGAFKAHPRLQVRMGVHSGPVSGVIDVNDHANLAGAGINMAQRVMNCGEAGHILVSKHVAEDLEEYEHWRPLLHDLGTCEVKHGIRIGIVNLYADQVGNPQLPKKFQALKKRRARLRWTVATAMLLGLAAIIVGFVFVLRRPVGPPAAVSDKSIAVLPFENLSRDPDNAYFADGIQDEILTRLSKIADLKVISRKSTEHYNSKPGNLPEIAKQLAVANILEGSVQKSGDSVRVNVQLIKAANDSHLWAETFDRTLIDIFSVESEVAKAIADQLQAKLTGQEERVITTKPTDNPEAYDAYLRGLASTLKTTVTPANSFSAQKYLREAVRLDPKFARSWALLSLVDALGYITTNLQPTGALREEARQAAQTALTLQPNLGEAVMAKGYYHYACLKDYDTAVRYFERARQLLPNSSRTAEYLALVARRQGKWDRSESYFDEAEWLDPRDVYLLSMRARSYIYLRRFPEASRKLNQVLDITPDDLDTLVETAVIAQAEGDLPRASAILAPLHPGADDPGALETQVYQAILERRPAQIIPRLEELVAKPDPVSGYWKDELRFWLGWAREVAGEHAAAQESWREARNRLELFLKEQPENVSLIEDLALINAGLGDKTAALALAERAAAANPIEKDAVTGSIPIEILSRVAAQIGEPDRAVAALQKLLSVPGAGFGETPLTPALLRIDPMFDSLRNHPRFQKLASTEPKTEK